MDPRRDDAMTIATSEIARYADELLDVRNVPDYAGAMNGLQMANTGGVTRIAAAVDFSSRTIAGAIEAGATLLLVHHGMFWSGIQPIVGPGYTRLKALLEHDIAVYASHLPLDRHAIHGNNVLLARELGLTVTGEFARYKTVAVGVRGESASGTILETAELFRRAHEFARRYGGEARSTSIRAGQVTRAWGICTGSGASADTLREAVVSGIDTLVVGEGPHHSAVDAEELGVTVIYAGHYATETLGVRALAAHLAEQFTIPWMFVDAPTGL